MGARELPFDARPIHGCRPRLLSRHLEQDPRGARPGRRGGVGRRPLSGSAESGPRFGPITKSFAGYAFDLDGTLYVDDALLPWAEETISRIRSGGGRVAFVTNKPLETAGDYAAKLTRLGVPADPGEVVTSIDALVLYMQ